MHTQLHSLIDNCPRCLSKDFTKNGVNHNKQRYKCKTYPYNFTTNKLERGMDQDYVQLSLKLYLQGMGSRAIEHVVGVSHVSVINWVKKYGKALKRLSKPRSKLSGVELDELCSYIGNKKKLGLPSC